MMRKPFELRREAPLTPLPERCAWCGTEPIYVAYHDTEWGRPETDSRALFEKLVLDGFQAGLSWLTILRKRAAFRAAFEGFDPARIARWGEAEVARALADPGIVRHRGKIEATVSNARAWLEIEGKGGFDRFLWQFVDFKPVQNRWEAMGQVPAETPMSREMSKALRAAGFRFCGPTIVYAFAQAVGIVNDHVTACPQHAECAAEAGRLAR
jgi:DNA-3-methyladenine glycosylase I